MKSPRRVLLVLVASFSIGAGQAIRAQTVYELKGRIYGPDSKPVPNVLVVLENNARARIGQDITGPEGRYEFNGLIAGTYYISVKPDETQFQPSSQVIELINTTRGASSSSTETVDFSLKSNVRPNPPPGTTYAQAVPPEAEKEYLSAVKSITRGDREQATKQLAKAIQIFPDYFLALQQLGLLDVENGSNEEAIKLLKRATKVNSKAAQAHLGLGMAYVNLDRPREAIEELSAARTLDPKLFRADLYLGIARISTGELDMAEKSLKQALAIGGSAQARAVHLYLASIYNLRKNYRAAITELETYLRENPKANNAANIKEAIAKLRAKL